LQFVGVADIAIRHHLAALRITRPDDIVDAVHVLKKSGETLEAIGQFGGDGIEIDATALLEVGELRDLESVEHHLPTDSPCPERGGLPVVLFKLDVMLAEIDT